MINKPTYAEINKLFIYFQRGLWDDINTVCRNMPQKNKNKINR